MGAEFTPVLASDPHPWCVVCPIHISAQSHSCAYISMNRLSKDHRKKHITTDVIASVMRTRHQQSTKCKQLAPICHMRLKCTCTVQVSVDNTLRCLLLP